MSGEVETSLEISGSRRIQRSLDCGRNYKVRQATRTLFAHLIICHDGRPQSASMNMAIDEALLESASIPTIRFYRWRSAAVSFGYFGRFSDVASYAPERDLVRRWTGGGIVFHGNDLTYSTIIPASDPVFNQSSITIYQRIHHALADAFKGVGERAIVAGGGDPGGRGMRNGLSASGHNCFANPVRADVMIDGRKIAGAAQRRTRSGLLQQGSIQGISLKAGFAESFAEALSANCSDSDINEEILNRARELAQRKYGTESWLRKR